MLDSSDFDEDHKLIEQLYQRWIIGTNEIPSIDLLPQSWQECLQIEKTEKLNLYALALASQHHTFLYRAAKPDNLKTYQTLPKLSLPQLEDKTRPLFRRALNSLSKFSNGKTNLLLRLLEQRKFTAHPSDWLPSSQDDDLPNIYWPWAQWATNESIRNTLDQDMVTPDNWDDWYPAERINRLRNMRFNEPDATRDLICNCAPREAADKRLKIVNVLAINLSDNDLEYIQTLTKDRSQKIVQLAIHFLARIGANIELDDHNKTFESAEELAQAFDLKKSGIIKKHTVISPRKLKSKKQQAVRTELLEKVPTNLFAKALGIASHELAQAWLFLENREIDNLNFVKNAIHTFSDQNIHLLLDNILNHVEKEESLLPVIHLILPRMDQHHRNSLMHTLLDNKKIPFCFFNCLDYLDSPLTSIEFETLYKTRAWKKLQTSIQDEMKENTYLENYHTTQELLALGLILPQSTAEKMFESVIKSGLHPADPALDCLKLNTQLK